MTEDDIELVQTSISNPEQYQAFVCDANVGYLRLRHGEFTVEYPGPLDELIYGANPKGDGLFEDDERDHYLTEAKRAIAKYHNEKRIEKLSFYS